MGWLFVKILNMSVTAGWIVLAVIVLRLLLKKTPKWIHCVLWGIVGVRLLMPISFTSSVSLIPRTESVNKALAMEEHVCDAIESDMSANAFYFIEVPEFIQIHNHEIGDNFIAQKADKARHWTDIAAIVWITVTAGMLLFMFFSTGRIRRRVREAVRVSDNVFSCDGLASPFILGFFRPCIYLPSDIDENDKRHVLAHEMAHIKRLDHIWKPLSYLLLSIYWFNPLMWVAYVLLCRDIEFACDEKVIIEYGENIKKAYSETLIYYSVSKKRITACPLAFGEISVKERVKNILNYRIPALGVVVLSMAACIVAGICFLTNPKDKREDDKISDSNAVQIAECNGGGVISSSETDFKEVASGVRTVSDENSRNQVLDFIKKNGDYEAHFEEAVKYLKSAENAEHAYRKECFLNGRPFEYEYYGDNSVLLYTEDISNGWKSVFKNKELIGRYNSEEGFVAYPVLVFDEMGRVVEETIYSYEYDKYGMKSMFGYNSQGYGKKAIVHTNFSYMNDENGDVVVTAIRDDGYETITSFDSSGNVLIVMGKDKSGMTYLLEEKKYNSDGKMIYSYNAGDDYNSGEKKWVYDEHGNLITYSIEQSKIIGNISYEYDENGKCLKSVVEETVKDEGTRSIVEKDYYTEDGGGGIAGMVKKEVLYEGPHAVEKKDGAIYVNKYTLYEGLPD